MGNGIETALNGFGKASNEIQQALGCVSTSVQKDVDMP